MSDDATIFRWGKMTKPDPVYCRPTNHEEMMKRIFKRDTETPLYHAMNATMPLLYVPEEIRESEQFEQTYLATNTLYRGDTGIPIGEGQVMNSPHTVKTMFEAAQFRKNQDILEVGTGSGYSTAILKRLCPNNRVLSIDSNPTLMGKAKKRLQGYHNLKLACYDVFDVLDKWRDPFNRIIFHTRLPREGTILNAIQERVEQVLTPYGRVIFILPTTSGNACYVYRNKDKRLKRQGYVDSADSLKVPPSLTQRL